MQVVVTGASGLIGSALVRRLERAGHRVLRLVRGEPRDRMEIRWEPAQGRLDPEDLEGCDAVVHLGAESIADGRWTDAKQQRIRDSRVDGTQLLARSIAKLRNPPGVLVCASAVGFYGDRGSEVLSEDAVVGAGFLAEVCQAWEGACQPARTAGVRVVNLRFGVVLSRHGGALAKLRLPFGLGLGGRLGSGNQWFSWIELEDAVSAICHALVTESLVGPTNAVSPEPVTNLEFTKALGRALSRPTIFPVPAAVARLLLGKLADELLLASLRVVPTKLQASGFEFEYAGLDDALEHALATGAA